LWRRPIFASTVGIARSSIGHGRALIPNLDEAVVAAIKKRAGEHGISMEEEVRRLLTARYRVGSAVSSVSGATAEGIKVERDALRERLNASIARGSWSSDVDIDAALAEKSASLAKDGF
jgi:plasmid stability protein